MREFGTEGSVPSSCPETRRDICVAITGTTGYLGSQLLTELAKIPRISRIYCLNRSPSAHQLFSKHNPDMTAAELVFVHVNLSSPTLGLSTLDYTLLLQDCNIVIPNAWRVDFNLSLSSFTPNLQSVSHLITLSAISPLRPRILFISSISATGIFSTGSTQYTVPESLVDLNQTMDIGYAESKNVAEHILSAASTRGVPVSIIRIGQIAPSSVAEQAVWPSNDLVPVFLSMCKEAGILASNFVDEVGWIPVDFAAGVVVDVMEHDVFIAGERFHNVVYPRPLMWSDEMGVVSAWCGEGTNIVSLKGWLDGLEGDGGVERVERFSALRMRGVYDGMASREATNTRNTYEMGNSLAASRRMGRLPAVDAAMMEGRLKRL